MDQIKKKVKLQTQQKTQTTVLVESPDGKTRKTADVKNGIVTIVQG